MRTPYCPFFYVFITAGPSTKLLRLQASLGLESSGTTTMGLREVELPALGLFLVQASDGMAVASVDLDGAAAQSGQVPIRNAACI